eukprot:TRINITY_DN1348_c0_g1_i1.p1 TRINITY_DN1348_c0_g1~~TRINITY_DN1348_c0_g1_i1.p1  ORF type:complete len:212 (+),score=45.82 TRINITY_DN1348_c0_g1_i1:318-953(+)
MMLVMAQASPIDATGLAELIPCFAVALKQKLRKDPDQSELDELLTDKDVLRKCLAHPTLTIGVAIQINDWVRKRVGEGKLTPAMATSIQGHLNIWMDAQSSCERIYNTPLPFSYAVHISQYLGLFLVTLPFTIVGDFGWFSIPVCTILTFFLLGIESSGIEIEDPFGTDFNDLPLQNFCEAIKRDARATCEIIQEGGMSREPFFSPAIILK